MDRTLLLNTTFEPLAIVSWKKAVTLLFLQKVEVIKEYDREIRSVSASFRLPAPKSTARDDFVFSIYGCGMWPTKFAMPALGQPAGSRWW